jgi:hypothetical protein
MAGAIGLFGDYTGADLRRLARGCGSGSAVTGAGDDSEVVATDVI